MRRRDLLAAGVAWTVGVATVRAQEFRPAAAADVLVVGGGAAGLSAAVAAVEKKASVLVLEKAGFLGGDTLISGGYFNAVDPRRQAPQGIRDSEDFFRDQILAAGDGRNTPEVAGVLARESAVTLAWLERLGMKFLPQVFEVYGSRWPRAHKPVQPRGTGYVQTLSEALFTRGGRVMTETPAETILREADTGRLLGVRAVRNGHYVEMAARRGVVLAAGGFGANRSLIRRWAPETADLATDSQPQMTGDMISAAEAVGARIINMTCVECVPGSPPEFRYPIRLDYLPDAMIIVNGEGRRFVEETQGRRAIAEAVLKEQARGQVCWCIASQQAVDRFDPVSQKNLLRGFYAGVAWREKTADALVRRLGMPWVLEKEIAAAGKERLMTKGPFWAVKLYLRIHTTLGGIATDAGARVLDETGNVISGLWAAGETVGSVHGAERIGGNGLAAACTFGRLAGASAAGNWLL